ncbi:hypothetical protein Tco_0571355 [Tanacetum coccineum]
MMPRSIAQHMKFNINQRHGGWKDLKIHHRIYHITRSSSTPTSRKNTIEHRHMGSRSVRIHAIGKMHQPRFNFVIDFATIDQKSELHQLRTRSIAQRMKFNINQRHGGWKNLKIHHRIYHITGSSSTPTSRKNTIEHRHMGFRNVWNVTVTEVYAEVRGGADITPTVALFTGTAMIYSPLLKLKTEQAANLSTHTLEPSQHFNSICYDDDDNDDDEERTIPLNEIILRIPPSIAITPILPTMEPEDSLHGG